MRRRNLTAIQSLALVLGCGAAGLSLSVIASETFRGALAMTICGAAIGLIAVAIGLIVRRPAAALERFLAAAAPAAADRTTSALGYLNERRSGYVQLTKIGEIPIFVHWSLPLGGVLISTFGGFDLKRALFYSVGYLLLIGVHEAGHVAVARGCGLKVFAVELSGAGGLCRVERTLQVKQNVFIYSAGLLAQGILLGLALCWVFVFGLPKGEFGTSLLITFTLVNLIVVLLNLIPFSERNGLRTDGRVLWQLYLHACRGAPHPHLHPAFDLSDRGTVFGPETSLLSMPALVPRGFSQGIEILNDRTTPILLVVTLLERHLQLSRQEAIAEMVGIHNSGGVLIPFSSVASAKHIAAEITSAARAAGHSLVCRVVVA